MLPFAAVALALLFAGLSPMPLPKAFPQQDKLHHMLGFAAMVFSARVAFPRARARWLMAGSLAVALSIELVQAYLPNRSASRIDMLANTFGVLLGWWCARLAERLRGAGTDPID